MPCSCLITQTRICKAFRPPSSSGRGIYNDSEDIQRMLEVRKLLFNVIFNASSPLVAFSKTLSLPANKFSSARILAGLSSTIKMTALSFFSFYLSRRAPFCIVPYKNGPLNFPGGLLKAVATSRAGESS